LVGESTALEVLLRSLRREKDEVQLTGCLVEVSNADAGVGSGLARALLIAATSAAVTGTRATKLLEGLPTGCSWKAEEKTKRELHRVGGRPKTKHGRIDWLLTAGGNRAEPRFMLGVEVKIDAALGKDQLLNYYEYLSNRGAAEWGLMLLARNRPSEVELLDPSDYDHWLGVALWRDLIAIAKTVRPTDETLSVIWPTFLDVLSADEDLGAAAIRPADLAGETRQNKLKILMENARPEVERAMSDELKNRLGSRMHPEDFAVQVKLDRATGMPALWCFVDAYPDPAITLSLSSGGHTPQLASRVLPTQFRRLVARRQTRAVQAAAENLQRLQPPFGREEDEYVRDRDLPAVDDDLRDVFAGAMVEEVREIIGTGILDYR
jgi:PD-(D/E)XK nuclease superfamily